MWMPLKYRALLLGPIPFNILMPICFARIGRWPVAKKRMWRIMDGPCFWGRGVRSSSFAQIGCQHGCQQKHVEPHGCPWVDWFESCVAFAKTTVIQPCIAWTEKERQRRNATKFLLVIDASYLRCWRIWFSTAVSNISPHRWSIGSVSGCGLRYERHNLPNQTREKNSRVRVHSRCFICHTISSVSLCLLHDRTCRSCLNVDFTKIDLLPWEYSPKQLIKSAGYRCRWTLAILCTVTCMSVAMVTIIVRMLLPAWMESW